MSENITLPPAGSPAQTTQNEPAKPAKGGRADYNQKLANDITAAGALLTNAVNAPDVLAALSYSESEVQAGLELQVAAQVAFGDRQQAQGIATARRIERDALFVKATDEFKAFRTTVQNSLPEETHVPLGATGRLPADLQKLVTLIRASYEAAQMPAYLPLLEKRKLTGAMFIARVADAESLERLDGQFKAADKTATALTAARDEAGEKMRAWISKFRRQVKSDLRRHPELLAKLGM